MSNKVELLSQEILEKSVELSKLSAELVELQKSSAAQDNSPLGQWLARIYEDQSLSNIEFQQLRDEADARVDALASQYPQSGDLAAFQKAADDAVQLMQTGLLGFKKQKLGAEAKTAVQDAYGFQVAYIKACLDRFTQAF
ncbi:hypothetical protein ACIPL1_09985 [Pseudomonas sp. NPDC090202]|uniref:hypothetical protein n=1 Tax=unclassified Pseudomonas TaxID=196821 RepID=UPI0038272BC6